VTGPTISAASGIAPLGGTDRTSGSRFGEVLGGVARSLAVVLALFGLAVAFIAVQDRFDRSDPRLSLAPVESDVVDFV
jgi:sugar/nucleoside kinase (ribokinase family)